MESFKHTSIKTECQILKLSVPSFTNHQHHSAIFVSGIHPLPRFPFLLNCEMQYTDLRNTVQYAVRWDRCIHQYSHHPDHNTEHMYYPWKFPCVSFQTNLSARKETTICVPLIVDKFIALGPALVSRNKILWPLAHLWWFHVPLEFESTFFWSFI